MRFRDGIPVKRAPDQGLEDKNIQRATQENQVWRVPFVPLGFHGKHISCFPLECKGELFLRGQGRRVVAAEFHAQFRPWEKNRLSEIGQLTGIIGQ